MKKTNMKTLHNGMSKIPHFENPVDEFRFFTLKRYLPDPTAARSMCLDHLVQIGVLSKTINMRGHDKINLTSEWNDWVLKHRISLSKKYELDENLGSDYLRAALCVFENSELGDISWFAAAALFSHEYSKTKDQESIYDFGFFISEFIQKNRNEHDYNRGIKTGPKVGSAGGKAKDKEYNEDLRLKRFVQMKKFIEDGHSVNRATQLCEKQGLGSAHTIRKQWYRFHKKKS